MRFTGPKFNKLQSHQQDNTSIQTQTQTQHFTNTNTNTNQENQLQNGMSHSDQITQITFIDMLMNNKVIFVLVIVGVVVGMLMSKYEAHVGRPDSANIKLQQQQPQTLQPQAIGQSSQTTATSASPTPKKLLALTHTPQQLLDILHKMQNPPNRPPTLPKVPKSTIKQNQVYFAYSLSQDPENQDFLQAEYYYYDQKYQIGEYGRNQIEICMVSVGRNLGDGYRRMLDSILRQNYSEYRVVLVDDNSDDGTKQNLQQYLTQLPSQTLKKITYLPQASRSYALHNRNLAIRSQCPPTSIILDLDSDDWLIGNQVLSIVNALYTSTPELWACYFNNIIYSESCRCPLMNADGRVPEGMLEGNGYRVGDVWRTSQLRTFRGELYGKIDDADFKDQNGNYYKWKSDAFINIAIVELAGAKHVKFIDDFLYFYNTSFSKPSDEKAYSRLAAKTLTPYNPLKSLQEKASRVTGYTPPAKLMNKFREIKTKIAF